MNETRRLARFRADPKRVRVAIRRGGRRGWIATVQSRDGGPVFVIESSNPVRAVSIAIGRSFLIIEGVDPHMEWAFEHPWPSDAAGAAGA